MFFQKFSGHFKIILISSGLFLLTIIFLLISGPAMGLAESKLTLASNISLPSQQPLAEKIAPPKKKNLIVIKDKGIQVPKFSAAGVIAEDVNLGKVLYSKNTHVRLSPASTTKIMTALVGLEKFKSGDVLIVPQEAIVGGSTMGLYPGENMTFRSLLYGMMLNSGNDAAYTIALNYPGGLNGFVGRMNEKARELGLFDTHFQNPAGFDGDNHYSSAHDLAILAKEAIKDSTLSRIVSTKETQVLAFDKSKQHELKNLNKLLDEPGVLGVKTGFTEKAGENLVGLVERNGHKILTVVLNSSDRFLESKNLMDWVYANFEWVEE